MISTQKFENTAGKKNIVILGAGFAGVTAIVQLATMLKKTRLGQRYSLILVNESDYHLFTPSLYEIASIPKQEADAKDLKSSACIPIEDIISRKPVTFLQERALSINRFTKTVFFSGNRALDYEFLIIAAGAETSTFGIPGIAEFALPLKTFRDAVRLRNRIDDHVKIGQDVKIVIAGGGPTGVELAAESHAYLCYLQDRVLKNRSCDTHIDLIEAGDTILKGFSSKTIRTAEKRLRSLGINIRTHSKITSITEHTAFFEDGGSMPFTIFVWTGGVQGSSIFKTLNVPLTKKGNVTVNQYLQLPEDSSIFVAGDAAAFTNPQTKRPVPWTVPIAESEGRHAAKNVMRAIEKRDLLPYMPRANHPYVLTVGKKFAIANLMYIEFSNTLAWCVKQLIELRYLTRILPYTKALIFWIRAIRYFSSND